MTINRRGVISAATGMGVLAAAAGVATRPARAQQTAAIQPPPPQRHAIDTERHAMRANLNAGNGHDQTRELQIAIDLAAKQNMAVALPPGRFVVGNIILREGTALIGAHGKTTLAFKGGPSFIVADNVNNVRIEGLTIDGSGRANELIVLRNCNNIVIEDVIATKAVSNAIGLMQCSARISHCNISRAGDAGIFSLDGRGVEITENRVHTCGNNGILVWRSQPGDDGSLVSGNRIYDITANAGGSGQNGNGINVYKANGVTVSNNKITDCAYSAVRGNAASNIQITGNSCARIGEVALYAEFGFEGALISSNLVDGAACGISVTNFNDGGRLSVIHGNLIRNLFRRENEPTDKRGEGISVEADATVVGNTIEGAATVGLAIGWGPFMRNVIASSNMIRSSPLGIVISSDQKAGACLVSQNLIEGATDGAIKAVNHAIAYGPDLASGTTTTERVQITGNLAV